MRSGLVELPWQRTLMDHNCEPNSIFTINTTKLDVKIDILLNYISSYERRKIIDRLSSHIDSKKASKLADKVLALAQELVSTSKTQKRKHDSDRDKEKDSKRYV